ncbi:hydantoinase/oxoprolinase family protein [Roseomonas sp. USHLN139]|uniref:hydantoinase/oxoprolinase family protein n=1 Tax=Roseomonas sp. USHLN139 TaxID=3081298 RepID=UPI003B01F45C
MSGYVIGVDVGGTFTDVVGIAPGGATTLAKAASTPGDQSEGVLAGISCLAETLGLATADLLRQTDRIVHGTTVATNALLEKKGARVAMLTTEGHRDVLEMREGLKPERYNLRMPPPEPLIPRERRLPVRERLRDDGRVQTALDPASLAAAVEAAKAAGAEAVAICFLHAWRDPAHEDAAAEAVRQAIAGIFVTTSAEVLPQIKEFERFSTTAVNAYVGPLVSRYLGRLGGRLAEAGFTGPLFVILSHGGVAPVEEASRLAVGTALSGPAGGVAAAVALARAGVAQDLVTFDMGGTSTDIALVEGGAAALGRGRSVGGERIALESLDIVTLGAGGGSIGHLGASGTLQVGPRSAGAVPGPAAYGTGGTEPTVTDANLALGYLDPARFLGGRRSLDLGAAHTALAGLGNKLGLTPEATAAGMLRIANARMADGIRVATVRRGVDPRGFALLSFGGAAGLHATGVAREIGISRVLVPFFAAGLSAWGMLHTDLRYEVSRSVLDAGAMKTEAALRAPFDALEAAARARMAHWWEGEVVIQRRADMRYGEQVFEIDVPLDEVGWDQPGLATRVTEAFEARHRALFTYDLPGEEAVLVNARLAAIGRLPELSSGSRREAGSPEPGTTRSIILDGATRSVPLHDFATLPAGQVIQGPAIVESDTTTVLLLEGDTATMRNDGILDIEIKE